MKFKTKRFLSGLLAFVTIATSAIQPVPALAAEGGAEKPPSYETVKEFLDADEVVTAKDLEIEVGSSFDIEKDFTNIEIPDSKKVKVTFEEAKNDQNESLPMTMRILTKLFTMSSHRPRIIRHIRLTAKSL